MNSTSAVLFYKHYSKKIWRPLGESHPSRGIEIPTSLLLDEKDIYIGPPNTVGTYTLSLLLPELSAEFAPLTGAA